MRRCDKRRKICDKLKRKKEPKINLRHRTWYFQKLTRTSSKLVNKSIASSFCNALPSRERKHKRKHKKFFWILGLVLAHASSSFSRWNKRSCACAYACACACVTSENQALTLLEPRFEVFSITEGCFLGMIVCRSPQGALAVAKRDNSSWTITWKSKGLKMFTDVPN